MLASAASRSKDRVGRLDFWDLKKQSEFRVSNRDGTLYPHSQRKGGGYVEGGLASLQGLGTREGTDA